MISGNFVAGKVLEVSQLEIPWFFFPCFHTRQSGGLFPLFCSRSFHLFHAHQASLRSAASNEKLRFTLSMDANGAPLAAVLIGRRFTFGRYFINPKRLAARKNLALPL